MFAKESYNCIPQVFATSSVVNCILKKKHVFNILKPGGVEKKTMVEEEDVFTLYKPIYKICADSFKNVKFNCENINKSYFKTFDHQISYNFHEIEEIYQSYVNNTTSNLKENCENHLQFFSNSTLNFDHEYSIINSYKIFDQPKHKNLFPTEIKENILANSNLKKECLYFDNYLFEFDEETSKENCYDPKISIPGKFNVYK